MAQLIVLCTAMVQGVVAVAYFCLAIAGGGIHRGLLLNLSLLLTAAFLALIVLRSGEWKRTCLVLNWLLCAIWSWHLLSILGLPRTDPHMAWMKPILVVICWAVVMPCAANGIALFWLPRNEK